MKNIIVWIVSIFFILSFLIYTPYSIANILFLISGLVILPPITKLLQSKIPKFNNTIKWIIFTISFIIGAIVAPTTVPIENKIDALNEEEIVQIYQNINKNFEDTVKIYDDTNKTKNDTNETIKTSSSDTEKENNQSNESENKNNAKNNKSDIATNNDKNVNTTTSNQSNNSTTTNTNTNTSNNSNIINTDNNITESAPSQNQETISQTEPKHEEFENKTPVVEEPSEPVIAVPTPITPTEQTVYITETGEKYHKSTCRHVKESCISISLSDALSRGYVACKVCKP